jgi:hypothetical protein
LRRKRPTTAGDTGFASGVKFRLTSRWPSVFFVRITEDQLQLTPDMKRLFTLTMLISFAMICSCQKQDSAAEQQLVQRKAELDAREKALDEREKALVERENATTNIRPIPAIVPRRPADAAQVKAERDRRIQQLPPEAQRLILDPAQVQARRQQMMEKLQRRNSGAPGSPATTLTNPSAASPAVEATSPSPSPTPQ